MKIIKCASGHAMSYKVYDNDDKYITVLESKRAAEHFVIEWARFNKSPLSTVEWVYINSAANTATISKRSLTP